MSAYISRLRLTGLESGLDTESIVDKLTQANKLRIQAASQQKILLEWKQDAYRSITSKLSAFQSKYYNTSGSGSSISDSLTQLTATYSSPYVSVTAGSSATAGDIYIKDIVSLASSARLSGGSAVSGPAVVGVNVDGLDELAGKSLSVTLDGVEKTITFSSDSYSGAADVATELSSLLNTAFGTGRINVSTDGGDIKLSSQYSTIILKTPQDTAVNPSSALSFTDGTSNRVDFNTSLSSANLSSSPFVSEENTNLQFKINDKLFTFNGTHTLAGILNAVNSSDAGVKMTYSTLTDTFTLTSTSTGSASSVCVEDVEGSFMGTLFASQSYTPGSDAVVKLSVNGSQSDEDMITITRSSNTFNVNGSTVTLLGKASGETTEDINISLSFDANAVLEKIKSFVSDYNELLSSITTKTAEERFRDFPPLTDDQKIDMSENEIALWTEKSQSGLLRNDIYLKSIETELRSSMYSVISGLGTDSGVSMQLSDIGISTGIYSDKGKLVINESKLLNALGENPDQVMRMFTQKSSLSFSVYASEESQQTRFNESGVLDRISDIIQKSLNKTGVKGALITLVGSPNDAYAVETDYSKRIKEAAKKIENLEDKLSAAEEHYYAQFTAMEQALSRMNKQGEWISSQFNNN